MSADRWSTCPNCRLDKEVPILQAALHGAVGSVKREGYEAQLAHIADLKQRQWLRTRSLRENYEVYLTDGGRLTPNCELRVAYEATCAECGWSYSYNRSETIQ